MIKNVQISALIVLNHAEVPKQYLSKSELRCAFEHPKHPTLVQQEKVRSSPFSNLLGCLNWALKTNYNKK